MLLRTPTIVVGSSIHACTVIHRPLYRRPFLTYIKEWPGVDQNSELCLIRVEKSTLYKIRLKYRSQYIYTAIACE